jgi:hypothetical protein
MTIEFTNLNAGEQRVELYKSIQAIKSDVVEIKEHQKEQNGKVDKHCRDIAVIKGILIVVAVVVSILMGFGIPSIPIW